MSDELSGRSVLVADDDEDNAELLAVIIRGAGAQARMAMSARAVLALVAAGWKPDAFLLDIGLPDMDGYELLQEIRKDPALSRIPAVAISGYATERDKARAAECGFAVHVSKPYDAEAVVHLVGKLTSPKREAPIARDVRAALASGGVHAALAFLNQHTSHRFTALYRIDGDTLRSLSLFDREDPSALVGDDAPLGETYCAIVARERTPFVTADAGVDPRLVEHPYRLKVRSYCGVLLRNADSTPFGSLCHFDTAPVAPPGNHALHLLEGAGPLIAALVAG